MTRKASKIGRGDCLALAAVAIPIAALFGPALIGDKSLAMRDTAHFYYPLFEWCWREWGAGRVPLWNPQENCGTPVLADATSSVFYPGKLLFCLPLQFAALFQLYVVGHVALAAATSYFLARMWNASPCAAAVAAISYSCGGSVVFQYCNVPFLVGAAWLPLAMFFVDRAVKGMSWRTTLGLAAVLALVVLGGDPEMAYHVVLAGGLYVVLLMVRRNLFEPEASGEWQEWWLRRWYGVVFDRQWQRTVLMRSGLLGLAAIAGLLLAAVQVLPSAEATATSARAAVDRPRNIYEAVGAAVERRGRTGQVLEPGRVDWVQGIFGAPEPGTHHEFIYDFSVGPWRLAEYVWPNASGRMFPTHRRWLSALPAEGRIWTPTLYLGLVPILFALLAFRLRWTFARQQWLSWLLVCATLGSFGIYGAGWLLREVLAVIPEAYRPRSDIGLPVGGLYWAMVTLLPYYVYFRYPAKLLPLAALALSQLAAVGWDQSFVGRHRRLMMLLGTAGISSLALALVVACLEPALIERWVPGEPVFGPFDAANSHRDVFLAFAQTASVALGALLVLRQAWRRPERRALCQAALLLLTALEISAANAWLVVSAPNELWRSESALAKAIREDQVHGVEHAATLPPRVYRASSAWRPPSFGQTRSADRPRELAEWEHATLFPKHHLLSNLSLVESSGSLKQLNYESLLAVARRPGTKRGEQGVPDEAVLRLLGTEYLILPRGQNIAFAERVGPADAPDWPEDAALWRMKRPMPRAWIVHEVVPRPPNYSRRWLRAVHAWTNGVLFPNGSDRDFERSAVVETDAFPVSSPDEISGATSAAGDESCRLGHTDPQRVVVDVRLQSPGLLVVSDAWYPDWRAVVTTGTNRREVPIYLTNGFCRSVWLPSGNHTVEFRYEPGSYISGAALSVVAWVILGLVGSIGLVAQAGRKCREK